MYYSRLYAPTCLTNDVSARVLHALTRVIYGKEATAVGFAFKLRKKKYKYLFYDFYVFYYNKEV